MGIYSGKTITRGMAMKLILDGLAKASNEQLRGFCFEAMDMRPYNIYKIREVVADGQESDDEYLQKYYFPEGA